MMIIYSNYFVEVHQVLHCMILFSKPLALLNLPLLTLFHQQLKTITKNGYVRSVSERALLNPGYITNFTTKNGLKNLPPGQ